MQRELYSSPNGDRWFLVRENDSGRVFVKHQANIPSGGQSSSIEIGTFLSQGGHGPEHQALLRLIGTLVEERVSARLDDSAATGKPIDISHPDNSNVRPPEDYR